MRNHIRKTKSIPFHASIRIRLSSGSKIYDKDKNCIGIHVIARTEKNKVAIPYRMVEFDIIFGKGIVEGEWVFDTLRQWCENKGPVIKENKRISVEGTSAWKTLTVADNTTGEVLVEKKFYKPEFTEMMKSEEYGPLIAEMIDTAYTVNTSNSVVDNSAHEEDEVIEE